MIPEDLGDILQMPSPMWPRSGRAESPRATPTWFEWDGETVNISQTPQKQKLKNLQRDNRVALSILDPENPYRYIEIRGEVVEITPDPDYRFIHGLSNRHLGKDYPWLQPGEERLVVKSPLHTTTM